MMEELVGVVLTSLMAIPRHSYPLLLPLNSPAASLLRVRECSTGNTMDPVLAMGL